MNHSKKFSMVKSFYKMGVWSKERVYNAVKMGWITAEEYEEIVGEEYTDERSEN